MKDLRIYRLISFTLISGKVVVQMSLETISRCIKMMFRFSQHGFMKKKCLICWMVICSGITDLVAEGRAVDIAACSFSKTFGIFL